MSRKDKGITKPKKPSDEMLTRADFMLLSNFENGKPIVSKEQIRLVTNMANKLNRRMQRMEKAGLTTVPGYQQYKNALKQLGMGDRFSKSVKGKTPQQLARYYRKMLTISQAKTSTVKGAEAYIKSIATTSTGQQLFTLADYIEAAKNAEAIRQWWEDFEELRDELGQYYKAGSDSKSTLAMVRTFQEEDELRITEFPGNAFERVMTMTAQKKEQMESGLNKAQEQFQGTFLKEEDF